MRFVFDVGIWTDHAFFLQPPNFSVARIRKRIIIITTQLKYLYSAKRLSGETILSVYMHPHTHRHPHTRV